MEEKRYTYEDFLEIIKTLRSENGCPWDREQTHRSLRPCMTEEAAEVLAAIRIYETTGNWENLREELGDVLLQVVMHACIAQEEGLFTMEDVVNEVAAKMVRRHPRVRRHLQEAHPPPPACVRRRTGGYLRSGPEELGRDQKAGKRGQGLCADAPAGDPSGASGPDKGGKGPEKSGQAV